MQFFRTVALQGTRFWHFLGLFQSPAVRCIHALTVVLVLLQLVSSSWMSLKAPGPSWTAWYHMWGGASLCILAVALTGLSFCKHGLRYFYPYLWGDMAAIKKDLRQTLKGKLVPPTAGGLAATVQGLGLGALVLTAFAGLFWFCLWQAASPYARTVKSIHEAASSLLIAYLIGHGLVALLHFISWERHTTRPG